MSKEIEKRGDLKASISALYELELNNYFMERTIHTLDEKIPNLGIPQQLIPPKKEEVEAENDGFFLGFMCFLFGVPSFIIGLIISALYLFDDTGSCMAFGMFTAGLGCVAAYALCRIKTNKETKKMQEKAERIYQKEHEAYRKKVYYENQRLERENKKKKALIKERDLLKQKCFASKEFMKEMYDTVGIDNDYRTFVKMAYMEKYARLGVADKLGGRDGLYLLVEEKIDREILKIQLSDIINNLNNLVGLHEDIRYELNQMNRKSDEMISLMERSVAESERSNEINEEIRENSAAAAYNIERMRREEEIRDMLK